MTKEQAKLLPRYLEVLAVFTIADILPGEELFTNYGEHYWEGRTMKPVRQQTIQSLSKALDVQNEKIKQLEKVRDQLIQRLLELERQYRENKKKVKAMRAA